MLSPRFFFLVLSAFFLPAVALAQTAPQHARDYIYGPSGRLAVTIEPDNYPPNPPPWCSANGGPCAGDGIRIQWGAATDIGSGVARYYGTGSNPMTLPWETTATSYNDYDLEPNQCYSYYVRAIDNAGHMGTGTWSGTVCIFDCYGSNLFDRFIRGSSLPARRQVVRALFGVQEVEIRLGKTVITRRSFPTPKPKQFTAAQLRPRTTPFGDMPGWTNRTRRPFLTQSRPAPLAPRLLPPLLAFLGGGE